MAEACPKRDHYAKSKVRATTTPTVSSSKAQAKAVASAPPPPPPPKAPTTAAPVKVAAAPNTPPTPELTRAELVNKIQKAKDDADSLALKLQVADAEELAEAMNGEATAEKEARSQEMASLKQALA